ncbi:MAG: UGSC family (seleno)protein [Methanobacterium formicicum]
MKVQLVEREVLDPVGVVQADKLKVNPLPEDFEKVSIINNTKPGAEIILDILRKSMGNRELIKVKKPAGAPATQKQIDKASSGELAILALGDCGSCTSWVILDAIRLEKMGIPTISICSTHFAPFAHELAKSHGMDELRILEIEHPIAGLSKEEVEEKTRKLIPSFLYLLQIP